MGLSYMPPPAPDGVGAVKALLGTQLPTKPMATQEWAPPLTRPSPTLCSSTSSRQGGGRQKDPVNKVYVQFSNDLEGFLPYTLVISEEQGLEFTSCSISPDFTLDPLNIIKADRVSYDTLMNDSFFVSLFKSIQKRPELEATVAAQANGKQTPFGPPANLEERTHPPYMSLVQLCVRRPLFEGGQVIVFIAVQSEPLAEELVRSCHALKKRRAFRHTIETRNQDPNSDPASSVNSPRTVPSRGCTTPRTAASRTPLVTPARSPRQAPVVVQDGAQPAAKSTAAP